MPEPGSFYGIGEGLPVFVSRGGIKFACGPGSILLVTSLSDLIVKQVGWRLFERQHDVQWTRLCKQK